MLSNKDKIKLVVFDQDGVLVLGDALDDMAEAVGQGVASRTLTKRLQAEQISLREVLNKKKALFENLPTRLVTKALTAIKYDPETRTVMTELAQRDIKTMVVTGSWTITAYFTQRRFKIDYGASSDEKTTMTGDRKIEAIDRVAQVLRIRTDGIMAIGNTSADSSMLRHVGLGFCIRPIGGIEKEFTEIEKLSNILAFI